MPRTVPGLQVDSSAACACSIGLRSFAVGFTDPTHVPNDPASSRTFYSSQQQQSKNRACFEAVSNGRATFLREPLALTQDVCVILAL